MKLYSARAATEVAMEAVQLFGGNGYMASSRSSSSPATPRCSRSTPAPTRSRSPTSPRTCCGRRRFGFGGVLVKFGIMFANVGPYAGRGRHGRWGRRPRPPAIESLWTVEHVVVPTATSRSTPTTPSGRMPGPEDSPIPDPLIWLTYLAAATTTVQARPRASSSSRSATRWSWPRSAPPSTSSRAAAWCWAWVPAGSRRSSTRSASRSRSAAGGSTTTSARCGPPWGEQPASLRGQFTQFADVYVAAPPVGGTVPIVIGGHSEAAARRAGRLGDGFFPAGVDDEELAALIGVMRRRPRRRGAIPRHRGHHQRPGRCSPPTRWPSSATPEMGVSRLMIGPLTYDA